MSEGQTILKEDIVFHYPRNKWPFPIFCNLILVSIFIIVSFRTMPKNYLWYFVSILAYLSLSGIPFFIDWIGHLRGNVQKVILNTDGIKVGKIFAPWDQIDEIRHGPWFIRNMIIRIMLKQEKKPFFSFKHKPKYLPIQAYPFVYRELIPLIHQIRPDLPISPVVLKNMANPEKSIAPRGWLLKSVLLLNIFAIGILLLPFFQSLISYMVISLVISILFAHLGSLSMRLVTTEKERFLEFALQSSFLIILSILWFVFSEMNFIEFVTIIMSVFVILILGLIIFIKVKELTKEIKISIVFTLIIIPAVSYFYMKSVQWPAKDVAALICGRESNNPAWGNTGKYLTNAFYEGDGCITEVNDLKQIPVPFHEGTINTIWLNDRFLIRRVTIDINEGEGFIRELWVYDFKQDNEFQVPTAKRFSIGTHRPVNFDENIVVWSEKFNDGRIVRFWNIEKNTQDLNPIQLPSDVNWAGAEVIWTGNNEVVVFSEYRENKNDFRNLHLVRINLENSKQQFFTTQYKYENWYPLSNFSLALGVNGFKNDKCTADLIDLETDKILTTVKLNFPMESPQSKSFFYVKEESLNSSLMRYKYDKCKEERICGITKGMTVLGISQSGILVITGFDSFLKFPVYIVVDLKTGRKHQINLSGIGSASSSRFVAYMPSASPFSPDERHLILETFGFGDIRTFLIDIPEKW